MNAHKITIEETGHFGRYQHYGLTNATPSNTAVCCLIPDVNELLHYSVVADRNGSF